MRGRGRRALLAASAAAALGGATFVGVAVAAQVSAPQPRATTAQEPVDISRRAPAPQHSDTAPRSRPVSIQIPAIGVDASFVTLGVTTDGSIEVPSDVRHVGWYRNGPAPGQPGPAIVVGHVDSASSGPGVFFRLGGLHPGDRIDVQLRNGHTTTFHVYAVREYSKDQFPTATVYGNTPDPQLRLITCGGTFDAATGHYRSNIVVYARQ